MNFKSLKDKSRGFTLIELLVVIAIIGLLATLSVLALNNARMKARDAKRLSDVKQIQTALELYFNSSGSYPSAEEFNSGSISYYSPSNGTTTYMIETPSAPTPADGSCSNADNTYTYTPNADRSDYTIDFCVAKSSSDLPDGKLIAWSGGIRGEGETSEEGETPISQTYNMATSLTAGAPDASYLSAYGVAADDSYIYSIGSLDMDGFIIKQRKDNLVVVAQKEIGGTSSAEDLETILIDGEYIYLIGSSDDSYESGPTNALIIKYNKADLSVASSFIYHSDSYSNYFYSATQDTSYLYVVTSSGLVKIDKSDLSIVSQKMYTDWSNFFNFVSVSGDGTYIYAVGSVSSPSYKGVIIKFNKSDLAIVSQKIYDSPKTDQLRGSVLDGDKLYVVGYTIPAAGFQYVGLITEFNTADLSVNQSRTYVDNVDENPQITFSGVAFDSSYLYVSGQGQIDRYGADSEGDILMLKINKSDLSVASQKSYGITGTADSNSFYVNGMNNSCHLNNGYFYVSGQRYDSTNSLTYCVTAVIKTNFPAGDLPAGGNYYYFDINLSTSTSPLILSDSSFAEQETDFASVTNTFTSQNSSISITPQIIN